MTSQISVILIYYLSRITHLFKKCNKEDELIKLGGAYYLPKNYSRTLAPISNDHHNPLEVDLEISNVDVLEVDDIRFTIKLQMHLGFRWHDYRIICKDDEYEHDEEPLDLGKLDTLWIPDLDIYNLSKIESFKVVRSMAGRDMSKLLAYFF